MPSRLPDAEQAYGALCAQIKAERLAPRRIIGIHSGGVWIAQRLQRDLGLPGPIGELDISFYRDDFNQIGLHAEVKPTAIDFEVNGAEILLVDDVLYTGRTIRGAMNVLFDYGRPTRIDLAVLIEREGRELPIAARWVGARVELPAEEGLVLFREPSHPGNERFALRIETQTAPSRGT